MRFRWNDAAEACAAYSGTAAEISL